ncbi:hypothetical protein DYH10_02105 [Candidatus Saccharibacteria bacterium CPR2]|nr:hypothetical protein [Candidatus Saccharibacteria bacterium CPR2]
MSQLNPEKDLLPIEPEEISRLSDKLYDIACNAFDGVFPDAPVNYYRKTTSFRLPYPADYEEENGELDFFVQMEDSDKRFEVASYDLGIQSFGQYSNPNYKLGVARNFVIDPRLNTIKSYIGLFLAADDEGVVIELARNKLERDYPAEEKTGRKFIRRFKPIAGELESGVAKVDLYFVYNCLKSAGYI